MQSWPHNDRREPEDRRARSTSPLSSASLQGTRSYFRRSEDRRKYYYVDRYGLRSVGVVMLAVFLSLTDAFFTLNLLELGAREANPVMNLFLRFGELPFLAAKYLLTGGCLLWFLIHKNYSLFGTRFTVKTLMVSVLVIYSVLIVYELILFSMYDQFTFFTTNAFIPA